MKTAIVPAQITTIEDKIAGNLSLSQLILLATPAFIAAAIYIVFPPNLKFVGYKLALVAVSSIAISSLAIRVKGKLVLHWLISITRYNLRPRYFVFDKNNLHLRPEEAVDEQSQPKQPSIAKQAVTKIIHDISTADRVIIEGLLANPNANMHFKSDKRGGLHVVITEVE
jgi:hypothetical protein